MNGPRTRSREPWTRLARIPPIQFKYDGVGPQFALRLQMGRFLSMLAPALGGTQNVVRRVGHALLALAVRLQEAVTLDEWHATRLSSHSGWRCTLMKTVRFEQMHEVSRTGL